MRAYNVYVWDRFPQILDAELRPEAEAVTAALEKALQSIAPVRARHDSIKQRVYQLSQITVQGEHAQHWAQLFAVAQEPAPPLPSDEAIEEFERARQAPAEPEVVGVEG